MLTGALIGLIVALIAIMIKRSQEKKAMQNLLNDGVIDTPEYVAFFHYASEGTQEKTGLKFFDHSGPLYIANNTINYNGLRNKGNFSFDLNNATITLAPEKRKMKWICIESEGKKHYFTTFSQAFFKLDKTEMDKFIAKLKELNALK